MYILVIILAIALIVSTLTSIRIAKAKILEIEIASERRDSETFNRAFRAGWTDGFEYGKRRGAFNEKTKNAIPE